MKCNMHFRNSRFGRGTQEDSHEALRCLLFALRQEEIKVRMYLSYCNTTMCNCYLHTYIYVHAVSAVQKLHHQLNN